MTDHRVLIILLRVGGVAASTAIIASVMPTTWIAATHRWLGLGDFPDTPITQYLARSLSAFYVVFGGLAIVVSTDVKRYAPIIRFFAYATLGFGVLMAVFADEVASGLDPTKRVAMLPVCSIPPSGYDCARETHIGRS